MIKHIVIWRVKGENDEDKAKNITFIKNTLLEMPDNIDLIKDIKVSENALGTPSNNHDLMLEVKFSSTSTLMVYQSHPFHLDVVSKIKPYLSERAAIGIEI